jgi:hypothetical protein
VGLWGKDVGNTPRWGVRHVLCNGEVSVDLREHLGDGGSKVAGRHHPLQACTAIKERVRMTWYAAQEAVK